MGSVADFAARRRELSPDDVAFIDDETGRQWRFAEVDAAAAKLGGALLGKGLTAGERVAILCHNRPEFFVALFACQKAGLILAPLNWRQPVAELSPTLASVGAAAILHDDIHREAAGEIGRAQNLQIIDIENDLSAILADAPIPPPRLIDEDEPWYLLFTSGTTGLPKAVIQTARMALGNAINVAQSASPAPTDRSITCRCSIPAASTSTRSRCSSGAALRSCCGVSSPTASSI